MTGWLVGWERRGGGLGVGGLVTGVGEGWPLLRIGSSGMVCFGGAALAFSGGSIELCWSGMMACIARCLCYGKGSSPLYMYKYSV